MTRLAILVALMALNVEPSSSITCPTCENGLSYDECERRTKSYDCESVGNTFTMCKVECNMGKGDWNFGCTTPTYCERQKHYCTRTKECNIACCEGTNCIQGNSNMTDPCRGSLTHAPKAVVVGACVVAGLYAMYRN